MKSLINNSMFRRVLVMVLALSPSIVFAHEEADGSGFLSGLTHPIFGVDHLLAMISVGIVSAQLGGKNIWRIPCAFIAAMVLGGVLGIIQVPLLFGELGIAISVIFLGISIINSNRDTGVLIISGFVVFFGIFHGHAHGLEMPGSASPAFYTLGFLTSTGLLHVTGVIIGEMAIRRTHWVAVLRYVGAGMAGAGTLILLQGTALFA